MKYLRVFLLQARLSAILLTQSDLDDAPPTAFRSEFITPVLKLRPHEKQGGGFWLMASTLNFPALVLNADFRPLSYFPLSLWSWQDTMKAVCLDRVSVLSEYDAEVHSPTAPSASQALLR